MTRGAYWLTIPQAALELKIGTAEVRRLIRRGQLPSVRAESVGMEVEAEASTTPVFGEDDRYAYHSFGAHFVEVRVTPQIGRIRLTRVVSVFDVGRVVNAKAVRSQFIDGIVFGIGQALLEELVYDRTHGAPVNGTWRVTSSRCTRTYPTST